jgi:type II secretion system protein G
MIRKRRGFTLIELLIVMILLALLTFMGIGTYLSSQRKSRDTRRKNDLQEVARALEMYVNDAGGYPASDASGNMLACNGTNACAWGDSWYKSEGNRMTTYMQNLPKDPSGRLRYWYYKIPNVTAYLFLARLENTDDSVYDPNLESIRISQTTLISPNCGASVHENCTYVLRSVNLTPTPTTAAP